MLIFIEYLIEYFIIVLSSSFLTLVCHLINLYLSLINNILAFVMYNSVKTYEVIKGYQMVTSYKINV